MSLFDDMLQPAIQRQDSVQRRTGYSARSPTLSNRNGIWYARWHPGGSFKFQVFIAIGWGVSELLVCVEYRPSPLLLPLACTTSR